MPWLIEHNLRRLGRKADPDRTFVKRLENRLLLDADFRKPSFSPVLRWATVATLVAGIGLGTTGAYAYASDDVLPGDALYPVKQGIEAIEEKTAWQEQRKIRIEQKHLQRRLKEDELIMKRFGKLPDKRLSQFHDKLDTLIEKSTKLPDADLAEIDAKTADLAERYSDLTENSASTTEKLVEKEQGKLKDRLEKMDEKRQKAFDKVRRKIERKRTKTERDTRESDQN